MLREYQFKQLKRLLYHAYENVPYYRKIFKERNMKPEDIKSIEDLSKLPVLDKDTFRKHFKDFIARNINVKNIFLTHTSGTTGKPLQFYQTYDENIIEWAFICFQWSRVGYRPGEKRVEIRGPIINKKKPAIYRPLDKVLRLSPVIKDKETVEFYIKTIKSFGARYLHGYPSAIATFANMIKKYEFRIPFKLNAIFFSSEEVYDWEREIVEEVFNCRVFSHYGLTEHVALAAECEKSSFYHFVPQYGIVEMDPKTREIIATGFLNYVNPFIRYRTTDIVLSPISYGCEYCGRQFPIVRKIEGRIEDFIITPSGTIIPPAVITHPFKDLKTIKNTQLVQDDYDHMILRVELYDKPCEESDKEIKQLVEELSAIMNFEIKIEVEIVDEIERTPTGKFKWIVSNISRQRKIFPE
jgi:phenylacetate-CoA ligase